MTRETLEWIEAYHKELGIAQTPVALIVRIRRGRPFTRDILAKGIRQVREKLDIPSELKLADLRRRAWPEMAIKGLWFPSLRASAGGGSQWTPQRKIWTPIWSLLALLKPKHAGSNALLHNEDAELWMIVAGSIGSHSSGNWLL